MVHSSARSSLLCAAVFLACLALPAAHARADDSDIPPATAAAPPPDRPFPTDRPGKASGPITVEQGHADIESDLINDSYDRWASAPVTTSGLILADPVLKYGVTGNTDLELQLGGYQHYDFKDRSTGVTTHADGWGDELVRVKVNLTGNEGGAFAAGIIPYVKIPSATASLRNAGMANNRVEGGVAMPMTYNLPHDFMLGYQVEMAADKNADNGNFHAGLINIPSISHPVPGIDNLTGLLEFYSDVNIDGSADDANIYTLDIALAYQVTPKLAFDVQTNIGLNRDAPDLQTTFGISRVF